MIVLPLFLLCLIIFLGVCHWIQTRSYAAKLINKFPPAGKFIPITGHVHLLSIKPDVLFRKMRILLGSFNQTFAAWAGIYPSLQIVTADDAEIILSNVKHINKGILYLGFEQWLQEGLLVSTGAKWHHRRKMLTPAFHYNILQVFVDIFGEHCEELVQTIRKECVNSEIDIAPLFTKMALATICETSMGINLEQNEKNLKNYHDALRSMAELIIKRLFSPWLHPNIIYNLTPTAWCENKLVKHLHKFTTDIIDKREESFKDSDILDFESSNKKPKKRLAMLDLLLYSKRHLGEIDYIGVREEVDTFVFEGHDTVSSGITFAIMSLAHQKNIQDKIIEELDDIFNDSDRHATYEDLLNMHYLERCIKECLRLYPSVPFIGRKLKEDVQFTHHLAPAGTEIIIHIYNIHRDPKYYPNPEVFDPDRFLLENIKGRNPFAYIPFSAGPRNCIGQKYAMLEMKSIVSSILRNFTMEPITSPEDLTFYVDIVLRAKEPINVKFIPRTKNV